MKRLVEEQRESKREKKKSKREAREAKWRARFLAYTSPRISKAVAASLADSLPVILVKDEPRGLAVYYEFWPASQEMGDRVLNLLECTYAYGHTEENDDDHTEGDLASQEHMAIVEQLCDRSVTEVDGVDHIQLYFQTTVDNIGTVKEIDDFSELPPMLYFQPCYGFF